MRRPDFYHSRERIYGLWGEIDIQDSIHAVKEVQRQGLISQGRVIVRGNSAGDSHRQ